MPRELLVDRPEHVTVDRVVDIDIYSPPGGRDDFHGAWFNLRETGIPDLVWTPRNGGHWLVVGGHLVDTVLSDYEKFSNRVLFVPKESMGEHHQLLPTTIDPPRHRDYRNLLNHGLSPKAVKSVEHSIRELAVELIAEISQKNHCNFTDEYAEQLPIRIFLSIMDLPYEDVPKIKYLADQTTRPDGTMTHEQAINGLFEYLEPYLEARAGSDNDDLLSRLVNGKIEGKSLTKREAMDMCTQTLIAGLDTVVNLLSFVMLYLARNPNIRKELASTPERISQVLDELLRRFAVVIVGREIVYDMEYEGAKLKKGEMIIVPTMMHSLDSRINPAPLDIKMDRHSGSHSTFGAGPHKCPGAMLAKTELKITLEEWLKRIPDFEVAPDSVVTFSSGVVGCVDSLSLVWDR